MSIVSSPASLSLLLLLLLLIHLVKIDHIVIGLLRLSLERPEVGLLVEAWLREPSEHVKITRSRLLLRSLLEWIVTLIGCIGVVLTEVRHETSSIHRGLLLNRILLILLHVQTTEEKVVVVVQRLLLRDRLLLAETNIMIIEGLSRSHIQVTK